MNITVRIERLVLDGLPLSSREGPLLQAAVEAELARLLAADGLAASLLEGGAVPSLPDGRLETHDTADARGLGTQIAEAVYGRIGR